MREAFRSIAHGKTLSSSWLCSTHFPSHSSYPEGTRFPRPLALEMGTYHLVWSGHTERVTYIPSNREREKALKMFPGGGDCCRDTPCHRYKRLTRSLHRPALCCSLRARAHGTGAPWPSLCARAEGRGSSRPGAALPGDL